jgi:hypothetical protein
MRCRQSALVCVAGAMFLAGAVAVTVTGQERARGLASQKSSAANAPRLNVPNSASNATKTTSFTLDDGTAEDSIGLVDGGQFLWFNRYTPRAFPVRILGVKMVFNTRVSLGDQIEVVVFADTDANGDPSNATFLGAQTFSVQYNNLTTWNLFTLDCEIVCNGPGDILVGAINRSGAVGYRDYPAAIDVDALPKRSWVAVYRAGNPPETPSLPADQLWDTIDNAGFPCTWMIRPIVIEPPFTISGFVTRLDKTGVPGVLMTFDNGGPTVLTDANGAYTGEIQPGWAGAITPSMDGMTFKPLSRKFKAVTKNQTKKSFKATDLP